MERTGKGETPLGSMAAVYEANKVYSIQLAENDSSVIAKVKQVANREGNLEPVQVIKILDKKPNSIYVWE